MGNIHLKIEIKSHHFTCFVVTPRGRDACISFSKYFIQFGLEKRRGRFFKKAQRVFAAATSDRNEFRFHINTYEEFKRHLLNNGITDNLISVLHVPVPESKDIVLKIRDGWKLREEQHAPYEYLINKDNKFKLLTLQTGKGKGFVSMSASSYIGKRMVIIIRPMFIDKWIKELCEVYDITIDNIMVVQGNDNLLALLELAKQDKIKEEIIIISNKTIQNWFKTYESEREYSLDLGYACLPDEMYGLLKAGNRLIDEVHMDIHLQCKIDLYTNVEDSISLSATLLSKDPFVKRMQEMLYPIKYRFDAGDLDRYIDTFAVVYAFENMNNIRYTQRGSSSYSHSAFEKSILRNRKTTLNYFNLIDHIANSSFYHLTRPVKRLLIFADTVIMCTLLVSFLKKKYPSKDVRRFCEGDPDINLYESEIIVSTIKSCGTARDIPDLTTVIMTVAIDSIQSNIQALGRLRKLKDNHDVNFFWFVCKDIPKHVEYHNKKEELMEERAKSFKLIQTGKFL